MESRPSETSLNEPQGPEQEQAAPSAAKKRATTVMEAAASALDAGETERAQTLIADLDEQDDQIAVPLLTLQARIAWNLGDGGRAVDRLTRVLVIDPEDAQSLHMLAQVANSAGEDAVAKRLENRLAKILAPDLAAQLNVATHEGVDDLRVAFVVSKGLDQFLDDIIRELLPRMDARKFVVSGREDILEAMEWSEVCWFEWCNEPIVWASRQDVARGKPVICRLHRYEAFSDMPLTVQWDHVDTLVVVAEHLGDLVTQAVPGLDQRTQLKHIPNGVDMSRYSFRERGPGFKIALIGYLHGRKNPGLALQILHRLVQEDPRYSLHVVGTFQDPALKLYWTHMVRALGLGENVIMHEWQPGIAAFLEDKDYLLSTSTHESFGYTIAEAMACGIKPVVHNFPHASDIWAPEILFNTIEEAAEQILSTEYRSDTYRRFIAERYTLDDQITQIEETIRRTVKSVSGETQPRLVVEVSSIRPQRVNAELLCLCPVCGSDVIIQQQTIAAHPIARQHCPSCASLLQVGLDAYRAALEHHEATVVQNDSAGQTAEIRRVAKSWASDPTWSRVMTVDSLNLGELMEFDISPALVRAWLKIDQEETKT